MTTQSPTSDTEWTALSVAAETREKISRQVAAGETYDDYLREQLPLFDE